jgi:D-alanyl-D-alanine endopeptidase (penicillin-binding protein 7)
LVNAFSWVLVQAVGWALLHFVWKGALIGIATALSMRLLRDAALREAGTAFVKWATTAA